MIGADRHIDPRKLTVLDAARAIPGLAVVFARKIPPEFWAEEMGVAVVSCPCGATASTEEGIPRFCGPSDWIEEEREREDGKDGCGRAYLFDGEHVRVAFSPAPA